MTIEQATAIKLSFGKYKGATLGEIVREDPQYCDWLYSKNEKTDPVIKKALGIILAEIMKAKEKEQNEFPSEEEKKEDTTIEEKDDLPF